MTRSLAFLAVFLAIPLAQRVDAQPRGQENFLTRAVFVDNELWVLSDAGQLTRIKAGSNRPTTERLPEPARDLCLIDRRPAILTCRAKRCDTWTLQRHTGSTWAVAAILSRADEQLLGLVCDGPQPLILTTRRLIAIDASKPDSVVLSEPIALRGVVSLHAGANAVFLGVNHGEFGGGLRQIDRATGQVRRVEHNSTGELCGGPLNTECDPVTGVAGWPGRPECVVAAIGLVHFRPRGRLVEVCGEHVRRLYVKPYGDQPGTQGPNGKSDEPAASVAFFGVVRDGDTLWTAGIDGIYRVDRSGVHTVASLPRFEKVGPFRVSFAVPGLALVLTDVNQRSSISGAVPMLVPRSPAVP
jgi:hypothetical protein